MGVAIASAIWATYKNRPYDSPLETVGQKLDRELREQKDSHERKIRDLEQEVERLKRRQTLGL